MTISMFYFDTPKFTEDILENSCRKAENWILSEVVHTETLKDNALREKMRDPSKLRIHLPGAKANIFFFHCTLYRQGGKCPKSWELFKNGFFLFFLKTSARRNTQERLFTYMMLHKKTICSGSINNVTEVAWNVSEQNWSCPLLPGALGELTRAMVRAPPWWWGWRRAGGPSNPHYYPGPEPGQCTMSTPPHSPHLQTAITSKGADPADLKLQDLHETGQQEDIQEWRKI